MPLHTTLAMRAWARWVPAALLAAAASQAHALPSFARQTGSDCAACHVGAFGPQLTPYGVKFKLGGYTDSNGKSSLPLSAMLIVDSSKYKVLNEDTGTYDSKHKTGFTEAGVFLAGKLADHVGSFIQVTKSGVDYTTGIDQADVRVTGTTNLGEHDALIGVSFNNNPSVQDPFNTFGQWGFPYTASDRLTYPGADNVLGSLAPRVLGVNAYTLIDNNFYGELGTYNSISPSMQSRLGSGRYQDPTADPLDPYPSLSNAPYWRLAYTKDLKTRAFNVGLMGSSGTLKDRLDNTLTTHFKDFGIDGGYQFLGNREHIVTVNASYLREKVNDTMPNGDSPTGYGDYTSKNLNVSTSYHYLNTYGATVGYFKGSYSGDRTGGNNGFIYQVDWTPLGKEDSWYAPLANLRVGLQYVRFNTSSDIDTTQGQKTSDLNSLRLFAWTAF